MFIIAVFLNMDSDLSHYFHAHDSLNSAFNIISKDLVVHRIAFRDVLKKKSLDLEGFSTILINPVLRIDTNFLKCSYRNILFDFAGGAPCFISFESFLAGCPEDMRPRMKELCPGADWMDDALKPSSNILRMMPWYDPSLLQVFVDKFGDEQKHLMLCYTHMLRSFVKKRDITKHCDNIPKPYVYVIGGDAVYPIKYILQTLSLLHPICYL